MPAISVLMPVFNASPFLNEAVDSILNQTFIDFEFLIFNDGSTDDTKEILASYTDPRIRVINFEVNKGYVPLLNLGLKMAEGKYIARMDADDVSSDTRFQKQYNFLEQHPEYILCGSNYTIIDSGRKVNLPTENDEIKIKMLSITPFCHPTVLIRRDILLRSHIWYDERFMPSEDLELWVELSDLGKFYNFTESLLFYRLHGSNISYRERTQQQELILKATQKKYISKFFINAELTIEEEQTLNTLFFGNHFDTAILLKCRDLLKRITFGKYNYMVESKQVHLFLEKQFFYCCTRSTHIGAKAFFLANQVAFKHISWWMNLRMLVKSLIRYQN